MDLGAPGELEQQGLITLADKGYQVSALAKIPTAGRTSLSQKEANARRPATCV